VSAPSPTVSALRSLLAARFPEKTRRHSCGVPAGVRALDDALGGGLPAGHLTELVSSAPSSGGQTVVARLLASTQSARQRMALIDGSDGFAPEAVPADLLRHLVWVRCSGPEQAFAAADILVRDGNYAVIVLDLRGCAERSLRRTPASTWYRLQRAAEGGSVAVLVQTQAALVPAVPWRLVLGGAFTMGQAGLPRDTVAGGLLFETDRSHEQAPEELAG
jgi:recA bacterial DNA recombination protein